MISYFLKTDEIQTSMLSFKTIFNLAPNPNTGDLNSESAQDKKFSSLVAGHRERSSLEV